MSSMIDIQESNAKFLHKSRQGATAFPVGVDADRDLKPKGQAPQKPSGGAKGVAATAPPGAGLRGTGTSKNRFPMGQNSSKGTDYV